jgi:hypothetical protein
MTDEPDEDLLTFTRKVIDEADMRAQYAIARGLMLAYELRGRRRRISNATGIYAVASFVSVVVAAAVQQGEDRDVVLEALMAITDLQLDRDLPPCPTTLPSTH